MLSLCTLCFRHLSLNLPLSLKLLPFSTPSCHTCQHTNTCMYTHMDAPTLTILQCLISSSLISLPILRGSDGGGYICRFCCMVLVCLPSSQSWTFLLPVLSYVLILVHSPLRIRTPMFKHFYVPDCETKKEFISCIGQICAVSRASSGVSMAASTAVELDNNIVIVRCWICSPEERGWHHLYGGATVERWLPWRGPSASGSHPGRRTHLSADGALCLSLDKALLVEMRRPGKAVGLSDTSG